MKAQMPMKMSMKIFTVVVVARIQPGWYLMPSAAAFAMISDSVMPPPATAAPSVLIASPIQAPATSGSLPEEGLGQKRQDQHFDHREHDDQRRHQDRHRRPRPNGSAGRDRRRDAADRD